jgi:hypothetical protein
MDIEDYALSKISRFLNRAHLNLPCTLAAAVATINRGGPMELRGCIKMRPVASVFKTRPGSSKIVTQPQR